MNRSCIARLLWMSEVAFFSLDKDTFEEDKNGRNTGKLQNGSLLKDLIIFNSNRAKHLQINTKKNIALHSVRYEIFLMAK